MIPYLWDAGQMSYSATLRTLGIRHENDQLATLGPFVDEERTGCVLFGAFMNFPMTVATEGDHVALGICAPMAPESPMMNLDGRERAAGLAAPPVAL